MIAPLDILAAHRRIARHLGPTPLRRSEWLSRRLRANVHVKLESVHLTNSFKIRGAFNAALRLIELAGGDVRRAPSIVTASAGNHGRAMALVSQRLGLTTTVFTPAGAPETKKAAIRGHGVTLEDREPDYDAAERAARQLTQETGACFISAYNHVDVIAGAGTAALEILDVLPSFDVLLVPLGGGGLASGLGTVVRAAVPRARIVGVEAAASTPFAASLGEGRITSINPGVSLADGLTGNLEPGAITFDIVRRVVDEVVAIGEHEIAEAIADLAAEEHVIAEGAAAVTTAAALERNLVRPGETAVVMVTGANIDADRFASILRARCNQP